MLASFHLDLVVWYSVLLGWPSGQLGKCLIFPTTASIHAVDAWCVVSFLEAPSVNDPRVICHHDAGSRGCDHLVHLVHPAGDGTP